MKFRSDKQRKAVMAKMNKGYTPKVGGIPMYLKTRLFGGREITKIGKSKSGHYGVDSRGKRWSISPLEYNDMNRRGIPKEKHEVSRAILEKKRKELETHIENVNKDPELSKEDKERFTKPTKSLIREIDRQMGTKGTTKKKLLDFSREEKRTAEDYSKRGFESQAQDEAKHSQFFEGQAKQTRY